jgi:hypothetical protein
MAKRCTYIDGIGTSQAIDTSGEIVDLAGIDISSLPGAQFNYEHKADVPAQIVGKIIEATKIFSKEDCQNDRHKYYWDKCQTPFLYVMGRLFDDKKPSSVEVAALFQDDAEHPNEPPMLGFSVEGARLGEKKGMLVPRSIARKITITGIPANKSCVAELLPKSDKKDKNDFDSIFKGEMQLFKFEETYGEILQKKELKKGANGDWQKEGYTLHHTEAANGIHHVEAKDRHGIHAGATQLSPSFDAATNSRFLHPVQTYVEDAHKRKGIASGMYKLAENKTKMKVQHSSKQTEEGKKFAEGLKIEKKEKLTKAAAPPPPPPPPPTDTASAISSGFKGALGFGKSEKKLKKDVGSGGGAFIGDSLAMAEGLEKAGNMAALKWDRKDTGEQESSHPSGNKFKVKLIQGGQGYELHHSSPKGELNVHKPFGNPAHAKVHAEGIVKKNEELAKALTAGSSNAKKHINDMDRMEKAQHQSHPEHVKGVHTNPVRFETDKGAAGRSEAGYAVRNTSVVRDAAKKIPDKVDTSFPKNPADRMHAIGEHKRVLGEMRAMPKPNLPKSEKMEKALTAGSSNAAPSQLTGGAALGVESLEGKKKKLQKKEKSHWYERAGQAYDSWDKKNHFKDYMKKRMPHLAEGEIDAIGKVLALKKTVQAEGKLSKMYASQVNKSEKIEKGTDIMMASENLEKSTVHEGVHDFNGNKHHVKITKLRAGRYVAHASPGDTAISAPGSVHTLHFTHHAPSNSFKATHETPYGHAVGSASADSKSIRSFVGAKVKEHHSK